MSNTHSTLLMRCVGHNVSHLPRLCYMTLTRTASLRRIIEQRWPEISHVAMADPTHGIKPFPARRWSSGVSLRSALGCVKTHVAGYKFEALSMLKRPFVESTREEIDCRPSEPVDNFTQYCSIVQTSLGSKTIIIAGEMDGSLFLT